MGEGSPRARLSGGTTGRAPRAPSAGLAGDGRGPRMLLGVAGAPGTSVSGSHSRGEVAGPPAPPGPDPGRKGGLAESSVLLTLTWTPGRPTPRRFCPDPEAMVFPRLCPWPACHSPGASQDVPETQASSKLPSSVVPQTLASESGPSRAGVSWREGFYPHRSQFLGNIVICTLVSEAGSADTRTVRVKRSPQSRRT